MDQKIADNFGFYAILTNPRRGYEYRTNVLVECEVPFVQLRIKEGAEYKILKIAQKLRYITEKTKTKLIINDFSRVVIDCGADGVHLGQSDGSYEDTRSLLGEHAIIGLSTHTTNQTEDACAKKPDYIGIGPVYATPTKKTPDPVIGLDVMKSMLAKATVPAVCIGGIGFDTLEDVLKNGAKNFCMVRPICDAEDPMKVILKIGAMYRQFRENQ